MVELGNMWIAHNLADKERTTLVVRSNDMLGLRFLYTHCTMVNWERFMVKHNKKEHRLLWLQLIENK